MWCFFMSDRPMSPGFSGAPLVEMYRPQISETNDPCGEKSAGVNSTMRTPSKSSRKIEELCIDDGVKVSYRTVQKIVADRMTELNLQRIFLFEDCREMVGQK